MAPKLSTDKLSAMKQKAALPIEATADNTTPGYSASLPVDLAQEHSPLKKSKHGTGLASQTPSAEEFLKMILSEIGEDDEEDTPAVDDEPTLKQIMYADSLGMEKADWAYASKKLMSKLIDTQKDRAKNIKAEQGDQPAYGLVKECLRFKKVEFDDHLGRKQGMVLLKSNTKATGSASTFDTFRNLRYEFDVPIDILVNITDKQAEKVFTRMRTEPRGGHYMGGPHITCDVLPY